MLLVYLILIIIVLAVSLTVVLWAGTFFFQGYIYTEPSAGIFWQAPATAALLTIGYAVWVFAIALNPTATPQNIPIDTVFRFVVKEKMPELQDRPAPKIWAIKRDRKKTGDDKDGEKIAYVIKRDDRGRFVYKDTTLKARPWQSQDIIAIELEKPDSSKVRFDLAPVEDSDYRHFVSADGWVMIEFEEGPTGEPIKFRIGRLILNLFFNIAHLAVWFVGLWLILRFQWAHALGFALAMWAAMTLLILPMILGYAGYVAANRQGPRTVAVLQIDVRVVSAMRQR